jgi:hypothetical protein
MLSGLLYSCKWKIASFFQRRVLTLRNHLEHTDALCCVSMTAAVLSDPTN